MPELELPTEAEPQDVSAMEKLLNEAEVPSDEPKDEITDEEEKPDKDAKDTTEQPEEEKQPPTDDKSKEKPSGEESKEEKPAEEKETTPEEDNFEKEVDKIRLRNGATEKSKTALNTLKQKAKDEHKAAKEWRTKYQEVENKLKEAKPITPELEKEVEELRTFRQAVDIEADPQFNQQFNQQISAYEEAALNLLKSWRLPDTAAKYIQDNGGVLRFRSSQEFMPATFKNSDGSRMTREQWWEQTVAPNLTTSQKEELGDTLLTLRQLNRSKQEAIAQAAKNRDKFIRERQEQDKKNAEDWLKRIESHSKKVLDQYGDVAKLKEMPKNPTPEQKAFVEKHNARYKRAEAAAQKYISEITPENLVESAIGAAYSMVAKEELQERETLIKQKDDRIKGLEDQIKQIKESAKTSHRQSGKVTETKTATPAKNVDAETAMKTLMEEQGKNES